MTLFIDYFIQPLLLQYIKDSLITNIICALIGLVAMAPFIWALMVKKMSKSSYAALWLDRKYSHGPLVMLEALRTLIAVLLIGFLISRLLGAIVAIVGTIAVMLIVGFVFRKRLQKFYGRIETRFLNNLHEKEIFEMNNAKSHLSPWDAHLAKYVISPHADFIGKALQDLAWREKFGINLAYIERGNAVKFAPSKNEQVFPFDTIGVIGTDEQLDDFGKIILPYDQDAGEDMGLVDLQKIVVDEHTQLRGMSIRESGLREKTDGLVVGIERGGERFLNPSSDATLEWDDIVWIVGNKKKIQDLYHQ
jgi:CPA2 family monovalent cation:H+ antiporter-2